MTSQLDGKNKVEVNGTSEMNIFARIDGLIQPNHDSKQLNDKMHYTDTNNETSTSQIAEIFSENEVRQMSNIVFPAVENSSNIHATHTDQIFVLNNEEEEGKGEIIITRELDTDEDQPEIMQEMPWSVKIALAHTDYLLGIGSSEETEEKNNVSVTPEAFKSLINEATDFKFNSQARDEPNESLMQPIHGTTKYEEAFCAFINGENPTVEPSSSWQAGPQDINEVMGKICNPVHQPQPVDLYQNVSDPQGISETETSLDDTDDDPTYKPTSSSEESDQDDPLTIEYQKIMGIADQLKKI